MHAKLEDTRKNFRRDVVDKCVVCEDPETAKPQRRKLRLKLRDGFINANDFRVYWARVTNVELNSRLSSF